MAWHEMEYNAKQFPLNRPLIAATSPQANLATPENLLRIPRHEELKVTVSNHFLQERGTGACA